jgi:HlyD family secretion protein
LSALNPEVTMSRPPRHAAFPVALVFIGLLATASTGLGQPPGRGAPKGPTQPDADLERFRSLDPAERLQAVEALPGAKDAFKTVARGDLTVAVVERGSLDAATVVDVSSQIKARGKDTPATTIKWVIEDGSVVKKGDRLLELDDATLRDEVQSARSKAQGAAAAVTAAVEEAERIKRAGEITVRLAQIEVELAEADTKEPPAGANKRVLELKVERAALRLEQVKDDVKGQQAKAIAEVRAKTHAAEVEQMRVRELEAELARCVLTAPIDGLAVYYVPEANRFAARPPAVVAVGEPVREGQKLIRVVNLGRMVVGTRVHESQISTVRVGQPVRVRVDAFPGQELRGKVTQVATVASQEDWFRSDVKVYPVTITLEETPLGLKPSMSAEVKIETGQKKGVLLVPATAVVRAGRAGFCFVKTDDKLVEREVTTGATDGTSIEVTAGLQRGDIILADPRAVMGQPQPRKAGPKGPPERPR